MKSCGSGGFVKGLTLRLANHETVYPHGYQDVRKLELPHGGSKRRTKDASIPCTLAIPAKTPDVLVVKHL